MPDNKALVTLAALNALIERWWACPKYSVDRFFPLRFWYLFVVVGGYACLLLFEPGIVAHRMSTEPGQILRISNFLYFRGWFLGIVLVIGVYAYVANRYLSLVMSALLIMGSVNLVFDLFNVYADVLANPTPSTTVMLIVRMLALWTLYLSARNAPRIPQLKDRGNIFLPFKALS